MKIEIVKAKPSNNLEIFDLERRVWKDIFRLKDVSGKYDLGSFIKMGLVFIAKDNDKIIGAIISFGTINGNIFVADWFVDKKYQSLGIGRRLYNKLLRSIKNKQVITIIGTDYKKSINFHKKMGFKIKKRIKDVYGIKEKRDYYIFVKK